MFRQHFVRVGIFGDVGRFTSVDAARYPRGSRVVCHTARALEVGDVLGPVGDKVEGTSDGSLLRGLTVEDELLLVRLDKNKQAACEACTQMLAQRGLSVVLMDVEHLFDGQSLFFYFLGKAPPELDEITCDLAERYEATIEFRKFAETLSEGCGPGCGTDDAENGCATGGCSTCVVASACRTHE